MKNLTPDFSRATGLKQLTTHRRFEADGHLTVDAFKQRQKLPDLSILNEAIRAEDQLPPVGLNFSDFYHL